MPTHQDDLPILNLVGEKVGLGPLRRDLVPVYLRWMNDFEVTRGMAIGWRPFTMEEQVGWWERTVARANEVTFTIYEIATMRPIGNTSLGDLNHFHQTAEFGILIGEKDCWDKGYGTETTRLMLDYGFNALGLHNIALRVYAYNERGIRAYTRAGFQVAGRLREAHRRGGRAYDVILMDCLATEFQGSALRRLLE